MIRLSICGSNSSITHKRKSEGASELWNKTYEGYAKYSEGEYKTYIKNSRINFCMIRMLRSPRIYP